MKASDVAFATSFRQCIFTHVAAFHQYRLDFPQLPESKDALASRIRIQAESSTFKAVVALSGKHEEEPAHTNGKHINRRRPTSTKEEEKEEKPGPKSLDKRLCGPPRAAGRGVEFVEMLQCERYHVRCAANARRGL